MLRGNIDISSSEWCALTTFVTTLMMILPFVAMIFRNHTTNDVHVYRVRRITIPKHIAIEMDSDIERGYCAVYEYN